LIQFWKLNVVYCHQVNIWVNYSKLSITGRNWSIFHYLARKIDWAQMIHLWGSQFSENCPLRSMRTKLAVPTGPIIKRFVIPSNSKVEKKKKSEKTVCLTPAGTQIYCGFKMHVPITCKSKVQIVVFLGIYWFLTNDTWHALSERKCIWAGS